MMSAPVMRIDEILALPYSADDYKSADVPPSDDDSWLYNGEDELNSELLQRQKEMELFDLKHKKKKKSKSRTMLVHPPAPPLICGFNPGDIPCRPLSKRCEATRELRFMRQTSAYLSLTFVYQFFKSCHLILSQTQKLEQLPWMCTSAFSADCYNSDDLNLCS